MKYLIRPMEVKDIDEIMTYLFYGFAVLIIGDTYYAMEFRRVLASGIAKVENTLSIVKIKVFIVGVLYQFSINLS